VYRRTLARGVCSSRLAVRDVCCRDNLRRQRGLLELFFLFNHTRICHNSSPCVSATVHRPRSVRRWLVVASFALRPGLPKMLNIVQSPPCLLSARPPPTSLSLPSTRAPGAPPPTPTLHAFFYKKDAIFPSFRVSNVAFAHIARHFFGKFHVPFAPRGPPHVLALVSAKNATLETRCGGKY